MSSHITPVKWSSSNRTEAEEKPCRSINRMIRSANLWIFITTENILYYESTIGFNGISAFVLIAAKHQFDIETIIVSPSLEHGRVYSYSILITIPLIRVFFNWKLCLRNINASWKDGSCCRSFWYRYYSISFCFRGFQFDSISIWRK